MSRNRNNNNNKGNKGYNVDNKKGSNRKPIVTHRSIIEYFNSRPQEVLDSFRLPFNRPLGNSFQLYRDSAFTDEATNRDYQNMVEPGICTIDVRFNPGMSNTAKSAANVAGQAIYTFVRHVNSGARNYDPADLMMYLMSMDSIYVWYSVLVRLYGIIQKFSPWNRYYAAAVVSAMGFNYSDLYLNLPLLRNTINWFVDKVGTLIVPEINYFGWHRHIFDDVYADSTDDRHQLYLFKPDGLYEFVEDEGAGKLVWHPWGWFPSAPNPSAYTPHYGLSTIQEICNHFFEKLSTSEDIGVMSGDIFKAYGDKTFKLDHLHEDYSVSPIFDEIMLNAISNATIVSVDGEGAESSANIYQDTSIGAGGLVYSIKASPTARIHDGWIFNANRLINMQHTATDPDSVLEATRFVTMGNTQADRTLFHNTEIVTGMTFYTFQPGTASGQTKSSMDAIHIVSNQTSIIGSPTFYYQVSDVLTAFDYAPQFIGASALTTGDTPGLLTNGKVYTIIATAEYDVLTREMFDSMLTTTTISLWDVPQMGTSR